MKFHLQQLDNKNLVTGYDLNWVEINHIRYTKNIIVMPDYLFQDWSLTQFDQFNENSFNELSHLDIEIFILGTGNKQKYPNNSILTNLVKKNISIEYMTNQSACRTYNIIVNEDRKVLLAIIFDT